MPANSETSSTGYQGVEPEEAAAIDFARYLQPHLPIVLRWTRAGVALLAATLGRF